MADNISVSEQAVLAQRVLLDMLYEMNYPSEVDIAETDEEIVLTITSSQPPGILIGKGGQTLDAVEMLVKQIVHHKTQAYGKHIQVDAEGYRAQHAEKLRELARKTALEVLESGESISLHPMTPRDRRNVHMAVLEVEGLETFSVGEEPYRHIVICLTGQRPEGA